MKKPKNLIPETSQPKADPQTIQVLDMASVGLLVIQINDLTRMISDKVTQLYNEVDKRQAFINFLPKPEAPKA